MLNNLSDGIGAVYALLTQSAIDAAELDGHAAQSPPEAASDQRQFAKTANSDVPDALADSTSTQ